MPPETRNRPDSGSPTLTTSLKVAYEDVQTTTNLFRIPQLAIPITSHKSFEDFYIIIAMPCFRYPRGRFFGHSALQVLNPRVSPPC